MQKSLFDIISAWTLFFNLDEMEDTLIQVSTQFNDKKVKFKLLEDLSDLHELMYDPNESMTDTRMSILIDRFIFEKEKQDVAQFVKIESSGPPEYRLEVLNIEETIAKFPDWFEPFEGMTWDDTRSRLLDK
ncbi:MAG: hypothetical protein ACFFE2_00200 [Candidatus Thorarchaeota archaeon]